MFYAVNKLALLAFYLVVLASFAVALPVAPEVVYWARVIAAVLLVAHAAEVLVFFGKVKLYKGPVAVSVLLTLLFGFLHWKPLADAAARGR
ncbi:MAG TPA: DUF1145 domain-containing protein [Candidatus Aquabacterium excrementipullorum]|nr:DUF1145 domain-containing protein [Candidatus Aquabacterium excrementipullorum]